jgi:hypothetical protein
MRTITLWDHVKHPKGRHVALCDDDIFAMLARPVDAPSKLDLPGWAPVLFHGDRRAAANVRDVTGAGIDIDGGATRAEVIAAYSPFYGYGHTTPSSSPADPRWRVFLPFVAPVDRLDAERVISELVSLAPGNVDTGVRDASRLWFRPWSGAAHFEHFGLVGEIVDAVAIAAKVKAREQARDQARRIMRPSPTSSSDKYARAAFEGELSRVHDAGEGTRNVAIATAAWRLGRFVGAQLLNEREVHDALVSAVEGWAEPRKTIRTLESRLSAGIAQPIERQVARWG